MKNKSLILIFILTFTFILITISSGYAQAKNLIFQGKDQEGQIYLPG